jgi:transcription elongation factor Elf1
MNIEIGRQMSDDEIDFDADAVDNDTTVQCPYCGEENEIAVDTTGGSSQSYVEDCQVCCQPWQVNVHVDRNGRAVVSVAALNG